jgi:hypothetical protein
MGLDGVEIVVKVENTFGISIEDGEAAKVTTPGQLIDLVLSKVGRSSDSACLTQRAFHRLRQSLMKHLGLARSQVRPDTSLADIFPRTSRKDSFNRVLNEIGSKKEYKFIGPVWRLYAIFAVATCGGVLAGAWIYSHLTLSKIPFAPPPISPIALGFSIFALLCMISEKITRGLCIEFEPSIGTAGKLSRWMVVNAPVTISARPRTHCKSLLRQIQAQARWSRASYMKA